MRERTHPLDFLFVLRPVLMIPLWIFYSLGARLASGAGGPVGVVALPGSGEWLGLAAMTAVVAGGYLLNQMADVETDRVNDKLFFLPRGIVTMRAAAVELAVVWALGLVAAWFVGPLLLRVALVGVFFSVTYSAPPIRAKARAGLDVAWNALGFGLVAALAGFAANGGLDPGRWIWSLAAFACAVGGVTASTVVLDREGDERSGLGTTAVTVGEGATSVLGMVLMALALVLCLAAREWYAGAASAVALALAVWAHVRGDRASRVRSIQLGVGAFALAAGALSPYVLALAAVVTLASRAYYRRRFGFAYPGPEPPRAP